MVVSVGWRFVVQVGYLNKDAAGSELSAKVVFLLSSRPIKPPCPATPSLKLLSNLSKDAPQLPHKIGNSKANKVAQVNSDCEEDFPKPQECDEEEDVEEEDESVGGEESEDTVDEEEKSKFKISLSVLLRDFDDIYTKIAPLADMDRVICKVESISEKMKESPSGGLAEDLDQWADFL
ncbi:hypothetical protein CCACVL1_06875 [Corchorus capsularis]|uniref:Uncharacterized protein n=1 Tax=Corchorus capsularis TaxID=210143 RepID=A0A1R3JBZ2_COCAP|nr:hypothetical protein CCACVL1_06875 [Corchorus capsularis]